MIGIVARRAGPKTDSGLAARVAAFASAGAALIHFAVTPTHWQEWAPSGVFFALLAVFQLAWSALVLARPQAPVLAAGVAVNLGSVALWAFSRTAGVPFGPHAGEPELVRAAGICALLLQSYVVMGAAWVWLRGHRPESVPRLGYGTVLAGAGTVIAAAAAVGVFSGLQHGHHPAEDTAEHGHHAPGVTEGDHHDGGPVPTPRAPIPPDSPGTGPAPAPQPQTGHDHDHHDHG